MKKILLTITILSGLLCLNNAHARLGVGGGVGVGPRVGVVGHPVARAGARANVAESRYGTTSGYGQQTSGTTYKSSGSRYY